MLYGLNYLGAVANLIDPQTDIYSVKQKIEDAKSKKIVVIDALWKNISEVKDEMDLIIVQDPSDSLSGLQKIAVKLKNTSKEIPFDGKRIIKCKDFAAKGIYRTVKEVEYEKDMPAVVTKTGGTTGVSKGVILTNDSINAVSANYSEFGLQYDIHDRILNIIPIGFSYGIVCGVHVPLCLCIENILILECNAEQFANLVYTYRPNHIIGVPIFYESLMNHPKLKKMDLSFLRVMAAGGDTMNIELQRKFEKFAAEHNIKYKLASGYGMSEVSAAATFEAQHVYKEGSCGIPCIYTNVGIFEPGTDKELTIGEIGEVCISGPTLMKGYINNPEETAKVMKVHSDGKLWVHSEDLGYIDEDGFLFITGRLKRSVVRYDGFKVYPLQIEEAVMKHHAIYNCCVVPTKDVSQPQGELPLAYVELMPNVKTDEEIIKKEIFEILNEHLELRAHPCDIVFIEKIPLLATGKNDYRSLMERK